MDKKEIFHIAIISLLVFLVCMLIQNPFSHKEPKPARELTLSNVEMLKLAFDTGYRACLENVLDGYIMYGETEEFENFLHTQVDMAVKPNLGTYNLEEEYYD